MAHRKTRVPNQITEANIGTLQHYTYLKIMTYCITTYCLLVHFDSKTWHTYLLPEMVIAYFLHCIH